ncbi:hypothetical protein TNCV_3501951 [Trichonephila clavipes]|uniref:ATP-dependent DNA helicase n=1 Tax=Trichonephila clavipes TaxID=2585209 RepID=A0A8X6S8A2_TRICX|nr:hypothetical protein TNCV_3501951 [Trichonephila clavipes]
MQNVIQATVLTGYAKGEDLFIPRIPIIPSDNTIQFKRIQFLLKLCFAMSINKSQGQSLGTASIYTSRNSAFLMGSCMWPAPEWAKRKIFLYSLQMELPKMLSILLF